MIRSDPQTFEKHNVRVLGTQIPVIMATEDRDVFAQKLREIDEKLAMSVCANSVEEGLAAAEKVRCNGCSRFICVRRMPLNIVSKV